MVDMSGVKRKLNAAILAVLVSGSVSVQPSAAGIPFFTSTEQSAVDDISSYQRPTAELLDSLKPTMQPNPIGVYQETQLLKGGLEDSLVVKNYKESYFVPLLRKLSSAAPTLKLDAADQTRLEVLPKLLQGHLIELDEAIKEQKAESQSREVQEIQETLAEFLKLSSSKYVVEPYIPTRPLSDKELFGPLGCEFWGKTRVPGSNACMDKE